MISIEGLLKKECFGKNYLVITSKCRSVACHEIELKVSGVISATTIYLYMCSLHMTSVSTPQSFQELSGFRLYVPWMSFQETQPMVLRPWPQTVWRKVTNVQSLTRLGTGPSGWRSEISSNRLASHSGWNFLKKNS